MSALLCKKSKSFDTLGCLLGLSLITIPLASVYLEKPMIGVILCTLSVCAFGVCKSRSKNEIIAIAIITTALISVLLYFPKAIDNLIYDQNHRKSFVSEIVMTDADINSESHCVQEIANVKRKHGIVIKGRDLYAMKHECK